MTPLFTNAESRLLRRYIVPPDAGSRDVVRRRDDLESEQQQEKTKKVRAEFHEKLDSFRDKTAFEQTQAVITRIDTLLTPVLPQTLPSGGDRREFELAQQRREEQMKKELQAEQERLVTLGAPALSTLVDRCRETIADGDRSRYRVIAGAITHICDADPRAAEQLAQSILANERTLSPQSASLLSEVLSDNAAAHLTRRLTPEMLDQLFPEIPEEYRKQIAARARETGATQEEFERHMRGILWRLSVSDRASPDVLAARQELIPQAIRQAYLRQPGDAPKIDMFRDLLDSFYQSNRADIEGVVSALNARLNAIPQEQRRRIAEYLIVASINPTAAGTGEPGALQEMSLLGLAFSRGRTIRVLPDGTLAVEVLVMKNGQPAWQEAALTTVLEQRNPAILREVVASFSTPFIPIVSPAAQKQIVERLVQRPEPQVVREAAAVLASPTTPLEAVREIVTALSGSVPGLDLISQTLGQEHPAPYRQAAVDGMLRYWNGVLNGQMPAATDIRDVLTATAPALRQALSDSQPSIRASAMDVLHCMIAIADGRSRGSIGDNRTLGMNSNALSNQQSRSIIDSQTYRSPVLRILSDTAASSQTRRTAIDALGTVGRAEDAELLLSWLRDERIPTTERFAAARALTMLGGEIAQSENRQLLPEIVRAMTQLQNETSRAGSPAAAQGQSELQVDIERIRRVEEGRA